ncbi:DUF58 domain-containing protein [Thermosulfurimonas marina]|uniref:DUF58 domain-containing protein n=1 Tax=Thermosulfurimonas marina TaxID=2047767 RepID=A0A6H1WU95_9BACT|nr:DUF58 domain-containing protein [Thermosulfurimonas marina]QJA06772.1 DUF58 domain-containing protein [Thermosulfurimonas marina]
MKRRYQVRITLPGGLLIAFTLAVALAAVNTGNNLLYLCTSALLGLMTVSGLLSFWNLALVRVEIEPPEEVFSGLPAPFRVRLYGPPFPVFFLHLQGEGGGLRCPYFRRQFEGKLFLKFPRRGRVPLKGLRISSAYPLGFFVRIRWIPLDLDLLVYPRPLKGGRFGARFLGSGEGASGPEEAPEDLWGLRPFREGEPAGRIAWRASALRGRLLAKEFRGEGGESLVLDLSQGFDEEGLCRATGAVLEGLSRGLSVGLRLPGLEIAPGRGPDQRRRLLEALACA